MDHRCLDFFRGILAQFTGDAAPLLAHPYVASFCVTTITIHPPFSPLTTLLKYALLVRTSQTFELGDMY